MAGVYRPDAIRHREDSRLSPALTLQSAQLRPLRSGVPVLDWIGVHATMRGAMLRFVHCAILLTTLAMPIPAFAWGAIVHEVICEIALQELTPAARTRWRR
jgi:hypothetical protein